MNKIIDMPKNLYDFLRSLPFSNYHKHTSYSNISTPDSGCMPQDYIDRALELGHTVISTVEHGFQGDYFYVYDLIENANKNLDNKLKFVFGAEAYWVKNRLEKDRANNHICILARNENGRKAINEILSEANETGYYYKPRVDLELLLSLPPKDVVITTACIGFWNYDTKETVKIVKELHNHFKDNLYLEVQYHNTQSQKDLNRLLLKISQKLGIEMIMGCDSHYIYSEGNQDRSYILEYKGIKYPEEEGWYMDYPSTTEAFDRFKEQGVLSDLDILNAINNTNICLEFEDIILDKDIKLPTLYPNKTQKEKNEIYKKIILESWNKYKAENNISPKDELIYREGIRGEIKDVIDTNMTDYFLINYHLVKDAVENKGGIITKSGRGSAVSYFTNTLLGFSNIDRFVTPIKLYPERFMSATRILETKSLPDIDLNLGNPEVFVKAQEELLGEGHSYPMLAYGTLKVKSAWKMYAGANTDSINFETANEISRQLEKFEIDYSYAEDEEKDTLSVYDYIDAKYHKLFDESKKYRGIIIDKKQSPCSYLIYNKDIRREIGLIRCKSESTKKEVIVCLLTGKMADKFKFLKNDLLTVNVCLLHKMTADRANITEPSVRQLIDITRGDSKTWDIYKNGYTLGVNQCEKASTTKKLMKYQPTTDEELSNMIAAIRPSFKSMYSTFEKREHFDYGIKAFDDIIQTKTMKDSFLIYQEQLMGALSYSGIPMSECYGLIKAISKKNKKLIGSYHDIFLEGFTNKILESENITRDEAYGKSIEVWRIIENSAKYGFNASHSFCMAMDSLRDAYYKAYYPYEFYEVRLNYFSNKGNKDKVALFKKEMYTAFGIKEGGFQFGKDNRQFTLDKENQTIYSSLNSIKGIGINDAHELYELSQKKKYNNFIEAYEDITNKTQVNRGKIDRLIKLDYFSEFGKSNKLLQIVDIYDNINNVKVLSVDKVNKLGLDIELIEKYSSKKTAKQYREIDTVGLLNEIISTFENKDISIKDKLKYEIEYLGFPKTITEEISEDLFYVLDIKEYKNKKSKTYYPMLYNIKSGECLKWKVKDMIVYSEKPFNIGNLLQIHNIFKEEKRKNVDGKWINTGEYNYIIKDWSVF